MKSDYLKVDYSKLRAVREEVFADIKELTKVLVALDAVLVKPSATATVKAKPAKRRKNQWHACPVGCGTKHRLSHDHMTLALSKEPLPETRADAFTTTHAA